MNDYLITEVVWASVVRCCNDLIDAIKAEGYDGELEFMDWEAVANEDELDHTDLLGPTSLGVFEESPKVIHASFSIGGSTYGEEGNLFRHRRLMGKVFERMRVLKQISLLHPETGVVIGPMTIVDGTALSPVNRTALRPYQDVHVQAVIQTDA